MVVRCLTESCFKVESIRRETQLFFNFFTHIRKNKIFIDYNSKSVSNWFPIFIIETQQWINFNNITQEYLWNSLTFSKKFSWYFCCLLCAFFPWTIYFDHWFLIQLQYTATFYYVIVLNYDLFKRNVQLWNLFFVQKVVFHFNLHLSKTPLYFTRYVFLIMKLK